MALSPLLAQPGLSRSSIGSRCGNLPGHIHEPLKAVELLRFVIVHHVPDDRRMVA